MNKTKIFIVLSVILLIAVVAVASVLTYILISDSSKSEEIKKKTAAISSNSLECAAMGRKIFEQGGNVADAAVTVVICEGIACPQSSGIGGGLALMIYLKDQGIVRALNAQERAPLAATADMFKNASSVVGGKSVAVPGELRGLWELHQRYGKLPWKELLKPNIELCREGHVVSAYFQRIMESYEADLLAEPSLREIFINPATNKGYKQGEKIKRLKLAETLEVIAEQGVDAFYGGEIGRNFIEDVRKFDGIMTLEDLKNYRAEWFESSSTTIIDGHTVHTIGQPNCGPMLPFMFNLLSEFKIQPNAQGYHTIAEAMKFAFAQRTFFGGVKTNQVAEIFNRLNRKEYADEIRKLLNTERTVNNASYYGALYSNPDDRGTTHISILAPNGDAISATNTINDIFGAMFRSQSTGIIPNDEMDDFSKPSDVPNDAGVYPTPNNYPIPGNNPMSSMVPTIVVDKNGHVRMVAGAAGGPRIISGTFMVLYRHLYFNEPLADAIRGTRIHHQISPMELLYEPTLDEAIVEELRDKYGHAVRNYGYMASATAITVKDGEVEAAFDFRRSGSSEVFTVE